MARPEDVLAHVAPADVLGVDEQLAMDALQLGAVARAFRREPTRHSSHRLEFTRAWERGVG